MARAAGEIYFIGEKDLRTKEVTRYFKVGIVRENPDNADRDSTQRLLEHQTGNPRELYIESVVKTDQVELVETLLHKKFATLGVRGEWMLLDQEQLKQVKAAAIELAKEALEITINLVEADDLSNQLSTENIISATTELDSYLQTYLQANAKLKSCSEMHGKIREILVEALEDDDEEEEVEVYVSVQERKGRAVFDEESFKYKYPEIYARYINSKSTIKGIPFYTGSRTFKMEFAEFDPEFDVVVKSFQPLVQKIEAGKERKEALHALSLTLRRFQAEAEWEKLKAESAIKVACGTNAGIEGVIKWVRTEKISEVLDRKRLKADHPDLVAEFTTQADATKAVIVDPKKGY